MKKYITLLLCLIFYSCTAFAQKQEWFDKQYDFKSLNNIYVEFFVNDELKNGITEKETQEIYEDKFLRKFVKSIDAIGYNVQTKKDILEAMNLQQPVTEEDVHQFIYDNFNAWVKIVLQKYNMGTQYAEGYTYSYPETKSQSVYTPNGPVLMTTTENKTQHVPGGNFPAVFVRVRFDVYDVKSKEAIWSRIDDRERINRDEFENTKPKDIFGRILRDFNKDFLRKINQPKLQ